MSVSDVLDEVEAVGIALRLEGERVRILALAGDIPALWNSPQTPAADRKEIIRLLVERVVVHVRADSERTEVEIAWRGGLTTSHAIVRSVSRYESMSAYRQLLESMARDLFAFRKVVVQADAR